MSEQKQVMALNPARKGNMGRINSLQSLAVYDRLIAQPWLKGVVEQIRGEKPMAGVGKGGTEEAVALQSHPLCPLQEQPPLAGGCRPRELPVSNHGGCG